jgi:deazaflavin-dependent oxidoreductase (nitroreductase family)
MAATTAIKMPGTPRPWMNAIMGSLLRLPGIRRFLGKTFAIMTVTGSITGNRYSTPVQYFGHGDDFVVLSQRKRTWWRNIAKRPAVQLLVKGETLDGRAALPDDEAARAVLSLVLEENPRVAKFYGLGIDDAGTIDQAGIDQLLERVVVIVISGNG